ncbi:hypothetical protein TNCV_2233651 [Trichonephila clavipes]|nr:hypothetical protein TNCV_2233651 [Trichonephila clavipes]
MSSTPAPLKIRRQRFQDGGYVSIRYSIVHVQVTTPNENQYGAVTVKRNRWSPVSDLFHFYPQSWVPAIRDISRSCLDPNDFTVINCIVKGHESLSPPSLRLRLC